MWIVPLKNVHTFKRLWSFAVFTSTTATSHPTQASEQAAEPRGIEWKGKKYGEMYVSLFKQPRVKPVCEAQPQAVCLYLNPPPPPFNPSSSSLHTICPLSVSQGASLSSCLWSCW